jgi:hypothetical protein
MKEKQTKRTDIHRPGAIIPAHYEYIFSYNGSTSDNGWPIPSFGINCEMDRRVTDEKGNIIKNGEHDPDGHCCVIGLLRIAKVKWGGNGGTCKCSVCGTSYVYGDVWKHTLSGEYLHVGHQCADKYSLLADRSEWDMKFNHLKAEAAKQIQKKINEEKRTAFLAKYPGLEQDLKTDHYIVQSILQQFKTKPYCSLTEKQVALVRKLAHEAKHPKEKEKYVPALTGKQTFQGEIISLKSQTSDFGTVWKITVKMKTKDGVWLAWGTCPKSILDEKVELIGATVEITGTLKQGNDKHFAFFSRPSGKILKYSTKDK